VSFHVVAWVQKHSPAELATRLVLFSLADHASSDGTDAYASVETLREESRLKSPRTVQLALRELQAANAIVAAGVGRGGTTNYTVSMDLADQDWDAAAAYRASLRRDTGASRKANSAGGKKRRSKGLKSAPEPKAEPVPSTTPPPPVPVGAVRRVFDAWVTAAGKDAARTKLTPERQRLIRKALRSYPDDELIDAVRGWRHSPHHRGENDRQTVYNDVSLLLRDAAHIEKFRDLERSAGKGTGAGFLERLGGGA
jgi:hypothetical protein